MNERKPENDRNSRGDRFVGWQLVQAAQSYQERAGLGKDYLFKLGFMTALKLVEACGEMDGEEMVTITARNLYHLMIGRPESS